MLPKAASSAFVAGGREEVDESIVVILVCNASMQRDNAEQEKQNSLSCRVKQTIKSHRKKPGSEVGALSIGVSSHIQNNVSNDVTGNCPKKCRGQEPDSEPLNDVSGSCPKK